MAQLTDELISRHGVSCIRKHVPIVINGLKVIVQGGHVTLQGRVSLAFLSSAGQIATARSNGRPRPSGMVLRKIAWTAPIHQISAMT